MRRISLAGALFLIACTTRSGELFPVGERDGGLGDVDVKLGSMAETIWWHSYGTWQTEYARGVALAPGGDVLVGGDFGDGFRPPPPIDFGGGPLPSGDGYSSGFLARFAGADGSHRWSRSFAGPAGVGGVAVDSAGNQLVAGSVTETVDFGEGAVVAPAGVCTGFVAKYSSAGELVWVRQFGETLCTSVYAIAIGPADQPVIGGWFSGVTTFPGAPAGSDRMTSVEIWDGFVAKLSADGEVLWTRHIPGPSSQSVLDVAVRADGAVAVAGQSEGALGPADGGTAPIDMPGADLGNGQPAPAGAWVARYGPGGEYVWSTVFAGVRSSGGGVAFTHDGAVVASVSENPRGFVARLSDDGGVAWKQTYPMDLQTWRALEVDAAGRVMLAGLGILDGHYGPSLLVYRADGVLRAIRIYNSLAAEPWDLALAADGAVLVGSGCGLGLTDGDSGCGDGTDYAARGVFVAKVRLPQ